MGAAQVSICRRIYQGRGRRRKGQGGGHLGSDRRRRPLIPPVQVSIKVGAPGGVRLSPITIALTTSSPRGRATRAARSLGAPASNFDCTSPLPPSPLRILSWPPPHQSAGVFRLLEQFQWLLRGVSQSWMGRGRRPSHGDSASPTAKQTVLAAVRRSIATSRAGSTRRGASTTTSWGASANAHLATDGCRPRTSPESSPQGKKRLRNQSDAQNRINKPIEATSGFEPLYEALQASA